MIEDGLSADVVTEEYQLENSEGRLRAWLYSQNLVVSEERHDEFGLFTLRWGPVEKQKFEALRRVEG